MSLHTSRTCSRVSYHRLSTRPPVCFKGMCVCVCTACEAYRVFIFVHVCVYVCVCPWPSPPESVIARLRIEVHHACVLMVYNKDTTVHVEGHYFSIIQFICVGVCTGGTAPIEAITIESVPGDSYCAKVKPEECFWSRCFPLARYNLGQYTVCAFSKLWEVPLFKPKQKTHFVAVN